MPRRSSLLTSGRSTLSVDATNRKSGISTHLPLSATCVHLVMLNHHLIPIFIHHIPMMCVEALLPHPELLILSVPQRIHVAGNR